MTNAIFNEEGKSNTANIINNTTLYNNDIENIIPKQQIFSDVILQPFTKEELEAADIIGDNTESYKKDKVKVITPVPEDAEAFTDSTCKFFNKQFGYYPTNIYRYDNVDGRLMGYMVRWGIPTEIAGRYKKEVRPYAYVEYDSGKFRWQSIGMPTPPLYNLPEIITRTDIPILVVEGEKTVEAAKLLFPDWVITTSMFGSQSAYKTDWSAVKGRDVIVCPDFDDAGKKYEEAVCKLATAAQCSSINKLDIKKLILTTLSKETIESGYDLADAVRDGLTIELIQNAKITLDDLLMPYLPQGFRLNGKSNIEYLHVEKDLITKKWIETWKFLCSYVLVTHRLRNTKSKEWSKLVSIVDSAGQRKEIVLAMQLLAGDGSELRKMLLDEGVNLSLERSAKEALLNYINLSDPKQFLMFVNKIGWHNNHYVLPNKVYGDQTREEIRLHIEGRLPEFKQSGAMEEWQQNIGRYAVDNHHIQMGILIALTAPILTLLGRDNFGIHFVGNSSCGKSTALRVACSVYGSEFRSWRTTDNAAESWGMASNDSLLALDDMGQASATTVSEMTYMLGNGAGKGRANRKGIARDIAKFKICFLSTGEVGVEAKLREGFGKTAYYAGQAIRLLEIPADANVGYGIFQTLHGFNDGAALSEHLNQASRQYCGMLGDKWLEYIVSNRNNVLSLIQQETINFSTLVTLEQKADGQVNRAKSHFALMAAVGEVAIANGILTWTKGDAIHACAEIFELWLNKRGGIESHEIMQITERLKTFIAEHGTSRFHNAWGTQETSNNSTNVVYSNFPSTEKVINRVGYRKLENNKEWTYYMLPEVFKKEILKNNADEKTVLQTLVAKGVITKSKDGKNTTSLHIPHEGQKRLYQIASFS